MRRSRYSGFYKTFDPRPNETKPAPPAVEPLPSIAEMHRKHCAQWRPDDHFISIVDSKQREWRVFDATDDRVSRYIRPFGSPTARVRYFWRQDHVRMCYLRVDVDHATELDQVRRQLRYSHRVDRHEERMRSTTEAIQALYESRQERRSAL